ncbi:unnamed protein product [Rodentolepis nana]|uniref:Transmembrane protein n=1 Tax=Rodentolepis nana TaxID=102285 RepID=A0A0R3T952_RODNA|nr:unnamed protein product [Rodentolepis nana]
MSIRCPGCTPWSCLLASQYLWLSVSCLLASQYLWLSVVRAGHRIRWVFSISAGYRIRWVFSISSFEHRIRWVFSIFSCRESDGSSPFPPVGFTSGGSSPFPPVGYRSDGSSPFPHVGYIWWVFSVSSSTINKEREDQMKLLDSLLIWFGSLIGLLSVGALALGIAQSRCKNRETFFKNSMKIEMPILDTLHNERN